jgi:hypothetical protein
MSLALLNLEFSKAKGHKKKAVRFYHLIDRWKICFDFNKYDRIKSDILQNLKHKY